MNTKKLIFSLLFLLSFSVKAIDKKIIPTPVSITRESGEYIFKPTATIGVSDSSLISAADYLQSYFCDYIKFKVLTENYDKQDIVLKLVDNTVNDDEYFLEIKEDRIRVESSSYSGIIYALSTLKQILPLSLESQKYISLPCLKVKDYPHFSWRGLMLDSSRHYWTVEEVKGILDIMSMYKLNKFHWHLTDDQGWRIAIKKYPLLTERGAWRKLNEQDYNCIRLAEELNEPDYLLPSDRLFVQEGDTIYGGYYSQDDIKEIVEYAYLRGIEIIPEIDMPGHFLSAIEQYPFIGCDGLIGWGDFFSSPICVGKNASIEFCKNILEEVFELFPSQYIHIGGDEVDIRNWEECKDCKRRISQENLSSANDLQAWFLKNIEVFAKSKGKKVIGWDEVLSDELSDEATIMWWRETNTSAIPTAIAQKKNIINTCNSVLYFDYEETSESLKDLLEFDVLAAGREASLLEKSTASKFVLGVQANIWTEQIASIERLEYMIFPRLLALSEVAWSSPRYRPDLELFYQKLNKETQRLDVLNINYRIPDIKTFYDINSFITDTTIVINSPIEGIDIRYTTDGSLPGLESLLLEDSMYVDESTEFAMRTFKRDGTSGEVYHTKYIKRPYIEAVEVVIKGDGLIVDSYDYKGSNCNGIESSPYLETFIVEDINIPPKVAIPEGQPGNIGLIYKGYIDIPHTDFYVFTLRSDDGSLMILHDELLIDNDGMHYPKDITVQVPLKKGLHPIEVRYFDIDGGEISLKYLSNNKKERIPKNWFKH